MARSLAARGAARTVLAVLLAVYAVAGLLVGLLILGVLWLQWLGLICVLGATLVAVALGFFFGRQHSVLAGTLLVVGGVLVGGSLGAWVTAYEAEGAETLALGALAGALILGWLPAIVGIGLLARALTRSMHACLLGACLLGCLAFAGCGGATAGEDPELPIRQGFTDCDAFSQNDDVATVDCADGELRVLVAKPEVSSTHFVPFRFARKQRTLDVSATARAPALAAGWGIGCLTTQRGTPGFGYAFVIGETGETALLRIDPVVQDLASGRLAQKFTVLSDRDDAVVEGVSANHALSIHCEQADDGSVDVRASVDGELVLGADDTDGAGPYTAGFALVLAEKAGTEVRFDDVRMSGTKAIVYGDPVGDQDARIALVRATAEKTPSSYGAVTSVYCQSEHSSCVVTYSAPACQDWSVESQDGVDVAKPSDEPPLEGLHGTYAEASPDSLGCSR